LDKYIAVLREYEEVPHVEIIREYTNGNSKYTVIKTNGNKVCFNSDSAKFLSEFLGWHHSGTADIANWISEILGIDDSTKKKIIKASWVHDIGKILIPTEILTKEGQMTRLDLEIIRGHPAKGAKILLENGMDTDIALSVWSHHESFDGTGYPEGLKKEHIPLISRIISVADTIDAISCGRHYHDKRYTNKEITDIILKDSGKKYDPDIAKAGVKWIEVMNEEEISATV